MNRQEVGQLLTLAALVDNRTVTPEAVMMWHSIVGRLDYELAVEAMRAHYAESSEWLLPVHVLAGAKRSRLAALPATMSPAIDECSGPHRRLPDGTCLFCSHRVFPDD